MELYGSKGQKNFFENYKNSFCGYISISIDRDCKIHSKNRIYKNNIGLFNKAIKTARKMNSIFEYLRCRVNVTLNTIEDLFVYIRCRSKKL